MKIFRPKQNVIDNENGFTLLEILIAASIMSALFVGLYLTFFSVTGSRARIDETLEHSRQVRRFMDVMSTEVRSSFYKSTSERTRFEGAFSERRGRAKSRVAFTWFSYPLASSAKRPASELMAVSYSLEGLTPETNNNGVLYKTRWNPYEDEESGYRAEVMEGVESFLLTYYTGKEWVKSWDASKEKRLPRAVKIELALRGDEGELVQYSTIVRTALQSL
jgi:type II secretion system protein J